MWKTFRIFTISIHNQTIKVMSNQLELVKWLKDQLQRTDIEFGEYQRNRTTLETAGVLNEEDEEFFKYKTNLLKFRYRWLEEQIQSFNKK